MLRVKELGDASVPFLYDLHVLIFSEDAVSLEKDLHDRFADRRVNLVNMRREFFYITPNDVKRALDEISERADFITDFVEIPEAVEWHMSENTRRGRSSSTGSPNYGEGRDSIRLGDSTRRFFPHGGKKPRSTSCKHFHEGVCRGVPLRCCADATCCTQSKLQLVEMSTLQMASKVQPPTHPTGKFRLGTPYVHSVHQCFLIWQNSRVVSQVTDRFLQSGRLFCLCEGARKPSCHGF